MTAITKINPYPPSIQFIIIHIPNRTQCRLWIFEFNKGESTGFAGFEVGDHADFDDASYFGECLVEVFFGGGEGEVSDEDVVFLLGLVLLGLLLLIFLFYRLS